MLPGEVDALSDGIRKLAMHFPSTEAVKRKEVQSHVWKVPRACKGVIEGIRKMNTLDAQYQI